MSKKFYRVKEAATVLNISERAAWAAIYRKQLPVKRWGRRVLISIDELNKFMNELTDQAA